MSWESGNQFEYYDFYEYGFKRISTEDVNDSNKIYMTTMKSSEIKRIGLFEDLPPSDARFPYMKMEGVVKSKKDVIFMHNEICVLLNEVFISFESMSY